MKLNVLYACDDNYAPFAGVSICSLLENNKELEEITIYIASENISSENITLLHKQVKKYGDKRLLKVIDKSQFSEQLESFNKTRFRGSFAAYYRIFLEKIIDDDVDRLLYLDCDTLVVDDLRSLLALDFNNKTVAAVIDVTSTIIQDTRFSKDNNVKEKERYKPYFNSGVILFNIPNWKKNNYTTRLLNLLEHDDTNFPDADQGWLNKVLEDDFLILPPKYNLVPLHLVYKDELYLKYLPADYYYSTHELEDARQNPVVLHTNHFLNQHPWSKNSLHPSRAIYDKYLNKSEWATMGKKENVGLIYMIERILYRILPKSLFFPLFISILYKYAMLKQRKFN